MQQVSRQTLWILAAVATLTALLSVSTTTFATGGNLFNVSRNLAFIGLVALGQTAVILTAGIDLSVGSVMGLSAVVAALALNSGQPLVVGLGAGLGVALLCGLINGFLIAYLRLSPFVVTLAMLAIARSLALVVSDNQMVYEFGPAQTTFLALGGGTWLGVANPVWMVLVATAVFTVVFGWTALGRHLYAIGGNEEAARRVGVRVARTKLVAYLLSSGMAGLAAILMVGWLGSVTNALGQGYELRVIAASVIGGAHLMGGEGGAPGALIGAALIEIVRNGLLLLGVDPYWQGTFVGLLIIAAVLLDLKRSRRA